MKVNWLLENDVFDADLEPIVDEIKKQGFNYKRVDHRASTKPEEIAALFPPEDCVIFYGSLGLSRTVKQHTAWIPGIFCDLPKFECVNYYTYLGEHLVNQDYSMLPFGELNRRKDFLLKTHGSEDGRVFVRPSSPFKIFTGKVIKACDWASEVKFLGFYDVEPDRVVVVSSPKEIIAEYRLVVVEKTVVSGCQYIRDNEIKTGPCPIEMLSYGQWVVDNTNYCPEPVWVLDVCEYADKRGSEGKLRAVMEVGAFSTSGLYCCPQEPIVREVSRVALKVWKDINEV